MGGTVTFGGVGSGIDVEGLITGLVNANKTTLNAIQTRAKDIRSAASTLSDIGKSLAALKTAAGALATMQDAASFSATSSNAAAVAASAMGSADPGTYKVEVTSTAKQQRTYSASFGSDSATLGQNGSITLAVAGKEEQIAVTPQDSLASVASKINGAGLRMSASVLYDGTGYRLQVRGLDTGAANALTFTELGTSLDLNGSGATPTSGKTVQAATDAVLKVDGFDFTRPTNQVSGIIPGVTLALAQETASPVTITVASDPAALATKIKAVVTAYNAAVNAMHAAGGYGQVKATSKTLAGDSALRSIAQNLSSTMTAAQGGQGAMASLGQIGISQTRDGLLQLDETKLTTAMSTDAVGVEKLLGRAPGAAVGGAMADLKDLVTKLTLTGKGVLDTRQKAFTDQAKKLDERATAEQLRLDDYAEKLRKQFTAMDTSVAANRAVLDRLTKIG